MLLGAAMLLAGLLLRAESQLALLGDVLFFVGLVILILGAAGALRG